MSTWSRADVSRLFDHAAVEQHREHSRHVRVQWTVDPVDLLQVGHNT